MDDFSLYFIYGKRIGKIWFIARRGCGFNENGRKIEFENRKIKVTRLKKHGRENSNILV